MAKKAGESKEDAGSWAKWIASPFRLLQPGPCLVSVMQLDASRPHGFSIGLDPQPTEVSTVTSTLFITLQRASLWGLLDQDNVIT